MKTHGETTYRFTVLDLGFIPRNRTPVPISREDEWAPEPVWTLWRKEKSLRESNPYTGYAI
jgi:hypothetical protein